MVLGGGVELWGVQWQGEDDTACSHIILASVNSQHFTLHPGGPTSVRLKVSQVSDITPGFTLRSPSLSVMVGQMSSVVVVLAVLLVGARGKEDNFCRPLEDYGPRYDRMEERSVCQTLFQKSCQPVQVRDCMNVTELQCDVSAGP